MIGHVEIREREQITIFRLDFSAKQPFFGDPPKVVFDADKIAEIDIFHIGIHNPGQGIAKHRRGAERQRRTDDNTDEADDLAANPGINRQGDDGNQRSNRKRILQENL
jgi:hypothetical protein